MSKAKEVIRVFEAVKKVVVGSGKLTQAVPTLNPGNIVDFVYEEFDNKIKLKIRDKSGKEWVDVPGVKNLEEFISDIKLVDDDFGLENLMKK